MFRLFKSKLPAEILMFKGGGRTIDRSGVGGDERCDVNEGSTFDRSRGGVRGSRVGVIVTTLDTVGIATGGASKGGRGGGALLSSGGGRWGLGGGSGSGGGPGGGGGRGG